MSVLLYAAGLIAGISVFFYFYSLINRASDKKTVKNRPVKRAETGSVNSRNFAIASIPPGERMCPLCRSKLSKREPLYASKVMDKGEGRILILGCRYCYKDE